MTRPDHHREYLARAVAALTPGGRARVDELLEELAEVSGSHARVVRFALAREAEADGGQATVPPAEQDPGLQLTRDEFGVLIRGFELIRDQEPLDDVADWANAVVALLKDERQRRPERE